MIAVTLKIFPLPKEIAFWAQLFNIFLEFSTNGHSLHVGWFEGKVCAGPGTGMIGDLFMPRPALTAASEWHKMPACQAPSKWILPKGNSPNSLTGEKEAQWRHGRSTCSHLQESNHLVGRWDVIHASPSCQRLCRGRKHDLPLSLPPGCQKPAPDKQPRVSPSDSQPERKGETAFENKPDPVGPLRTRTWETTPARKYRRRDRALTPLALLTGLKVSHLVILQYLCQPWLCRKKLHLRKMGTIKSECVPLRKSPLR